MKRTVYEAPLTELFRVELESGFCSGSADVENPDTGTGKIADHEVNAYFGNNSGDYSDIFGDDGWE